MLVSFSFIVCLLLFVFIGVLSVFVRKKTKKDYMLAGQDLSPWLVALSAVATNNSGYMFIGMIGYTYLVGMSAIWLMVGWIAGDFLASLFIHLRLRNFTAKSKSLSFGSVLSKWHGHDYRYLRILVAILTIIFLGIYAAAQLKAGSKALHVLFGWHYALGAIIGATIVLLYCVAGGIRASIWTDAAQSFVMLLGMSLLFVKALVSLGGFTGLWQGISAISPEYISLFPEGVLFGNYLGLIVFVISWILAGFGVIGQPHIMVRFMAMESNVNMTHVRVYYYSWYLTFFLLTIGVGLAARLLIPAASFDPELALPLLAQQLLPDILVGLVLAALFAATISTADSQILSCAAAFVADLGIKAKNGYIAAKLGTVIATAIALTVALYGHENVFHLVLIAWSVLSAAFAPLLCAYCLGAKPSERVAIAMVIAGIATVLIWRQLGWQDAVYEAGPGIVMGFAPLLLAKLSAKARAR